MPKSLNALALLALSTATLAGQEISWSYRGVAGEAYGAALTPVGDWDRDGIPDWAAGAPYGGDDSGTTGGYVRVHSGRSGAEISRFSGPAGQGAFGAALAAAGDVDRDGIPDLLIGAPRAEGNMPAAGLAAVYSGRDGQLVLEFRGGAAYSRFGASVAGIGDVNRDGRPDLLIGAPGDSGQGREAGSAAVFSGLDGSLLHLLTGPGPMARFGSAGCGVGDLDADGADDFAVGAPGDGAEEEGSVSVYSGATGALLRVERGARPGAAFGASLAFAGDIDGDGFGDWVAGAPGAGSGSAAAFSGKRGTLLHHLMGPAPGSRFGASVSSAGDLDGDGFDDLVVGAPRDGLGGPEAGSVTAFSGADGAVLDRWTGDPGERAGSAVAPIDPTLLHAGFVSSGRGRKDLGVVRLRRWKPRRGPAPVAAAAPVASSQYASSSAGYASSSSTVVTTRFYFYYWASGCGPWWGYYWSPRLWWPYSYRCYWWGPPRYWWWNCWDPCWSCHYDPCCCGSYWDEGSSGGSGSGSGGGTPPPVGPISASPTPFPGGGTGTSSLVAGVTERAPVNPAGGSGAAGASGSALGGGGSGGSDGSGAVTLAPSATTVRVPLRPAGGGSSSASPPPSGGVVNPPGTTAVRPNRPAQGQPSRPALPPRASTPPPARVTPPARAAPPSRATPPPRSAPPARATPPSRSSSPPRSASPARGSSGSGRSGVSGAGRSGGGSSRGSAASRGSSGGGSRGSARGSARGSNSGGGGSRGGRPKASQDRAVAAAAPARSSPSAAKTRSAAPAKARSKAKPATASRATASRAKTSRATASRAKTSRPATARSSASRPTPRPAARPAPSPRPSSRANPGGGGRGSRPAGQGRGRRRS